MSKKHVALIVEDEPEMAAELGELVSSLGHASVHAETQEEARGLVERGEFCYVLLDLQIKINADSIKPRVEAGQGLLEQIREVYATRVDQHWHCLPVIIVSGHAKEHAFVVRAFKTGVDDFVTKPLGENQPSLEEKIRECLRASGRESHAKCAEVMRAARGAGGAKATENDDARPAVLREGDLLAIRFSGKTARFQRFEGLIDLAVLFARVGVEVPAKVLYERPGSGADIALRQGELERSSVAPARGGYGRDADPILDDDAIADVKAAVERYREQGDAEGLEKAEELERRYLIPALDRRGRARRLASPQTRARVAVQKRIKAALVLVARDLPELYEHLGGERIFSKRSRGSAALRTGTLCCYSPIEPVAWVVDV